MRKIIIYTLLDIERSVYVSTKNLGGRPQKYKTEDLIQALNDYVAKEAPSKVTITALVKNTSYPIQAWRFNNEVRKAIEEINLKLITFSKLSPSQDAQSLLLIPNAEDIVNNNYNNREKLIDAVQSLIDIYQYNLKKCLKIEAMEEELGRLKIENKNLKKEAEFYKDRLKEMKVKSHNSYDREKNGLEKNELNIVEFSHTKTTFKDLFD